MRDVAPDARVGWKHPGDPGEVSTSKPRLSISENEANILTALSFQMIACELGTGLGVSSRAIALYAESLVTVDVDPWVAETIVPELLDEYDNIAFVENRDLISDERCFDFIFIDANHETAAVAADLAWALRHVYSDGSLIVMHDVKYDNVRPVVPMNAIRLDTEHGLAVIPVGA